ncbi:MAG TPA: lysophospholipid acyltransferase family protein [Opitutaceae bacterium]|nr:lysophospholipid acyltransferase family protein [Opitutaceae bacterium]
MNRCDHLAMQPVYGVCHYVILNIYDACFRGEVNGLENIPAQGSFILAANHASLLDPPAIGCHVPRQFSFFARKSLWKPGFASWWLDTVGTIPVDRDGSTDVMAIKRVLQALRAGRPIIMFPEGTRSRDGRLQPAKSGIGMLACRAAVPVVPARIFGSFDAFGPSRGLQLGTPIDITYGRILQPPDFDDPAAGKDRYQRASGKIMSAIAALEVPQPVVV